MNKSILDIKLHAAINENVDATKHSLYEEVIETDNILHTHKKSYLIELSQSHSVTEKHPSD